MDGELDDFDAFDSVNNLEETYYQQGYKDGFEHGRLHGLFEGRAIGQEKAYEIWEEVGYIEGVALFWQGISQKQKNGELQAGKKVSSRVQLHIQTLINLISTFPTINPTPGQDAPVSLSESNPSSSALTRSQEEPDLSVLLERIRARYKLLCSALGIRPRLAVASLPGPNETYGEEGEGVQGQNGNAGTEGGSSLVQGVEGSGVGRGMIDGVDTRLLRF